MKQAVKDILVAISTGHSLGEKVSFQEDSHEDNLGDLADEEREALFDFDDENVASQMEKAQSQLAPLQRYSLGEDFSLYIDAIIKNSYAVAEVSRDSLKKTITALCQQVCTHFRLDHVIYM